MAAPQLPTDLQQAVESKPFWYHKIELPGGITTPGWAPLAAEAYRIPEDMTDMRVLDIGAWDGFWTFEALRRGAKEVVAIDDFSDYLGMLGNEDRRAWENFDLCRDAMGYSASQAQRIEMSVYDVNEARLGKFDAVFFFGTLYHLRYPLLAMDLISSVCDNALFVETAICDDYSPYRGGFGQGYPGGHAVVEFYPNTEYGNNPTNWWAPTLGALGLMTMAAGWTDIEVWKLVDTPTELAHCRGFARAFKCEKLPS